MPKRVYITKEATVLRTQNNEAYMSIAIFFAAILWASIVLILLIWRNENQRTKLFVSKAILPSPRAERNKAKQNRAYAEMKAQSRLLRGRDD